MAKRSQVSAPTTLQLTRFLERHLDGPLAELATLAIFWRITPLRLLMLINNPFWAETLVERLRQPLQDLAEQHGRSLHIISGSVTSAATDSHKHTFTTLIN